MTPDSTMPLPPSEPPTHAHPSADPWAATPQPGTYPVAPAPFPAPPAPPVAPSASPVPPAAFIDPAATAQFSAPPAPQSVPPAMVAQPGLHPPAFAPISAQPAVLPGAQSVVAVQIGEIMVTPPVIRTPAGALPLAGSSWHVADYWQKEEKVATWALVCAILGFFCLTVFSLLFLLVKETRHHGTVQVTVTNGARQYVARIPVADQGQVQHINNQVNYARSLSVA